MSSQYFYLKKSAKFSTYDLNTTLWNSKGDDERENPLYIYLDWNCEYVEKIILDAISRRSRYCHMIKDVKSDDNVQQYQQKYGKHPCILQFAEFEKMQWEYVLSGRTLGSNYVVRKGLSRKAQLALQINRYIKKNPHSILQNAVPESHILDTWDIFQDKDQQNLTSESTMKIQLGTGLATDFSNIYDLQRMSVRKKLEWHFAGNVEELFPLKTDDQETIQKKQHPWILKPSVTNKGLDISIISSYDQLLDTLEEKSDIREWVLQDYVANPLLIVKRKHKFHLRVYILCIGALQVFMFNEILVLIAANP
jgi:tubulin--tyrosine ligase